jgi:hypothetical protein
MRAWLSIVTPIESGDCVATLPNYSSLRLRTPVPSRISPFVAGWKKYVIHLGIMTVFCVAAAFEPVMTYGKPKLLGS